MTKAIYSAIALAGIMLLSSCASTTKGTEPSGPSAEDLLALMMGTFATNPDDPDYNFQDQRVRVDSPALDGLWFYSQLKSGSERTVYRQRIAHLQTADDGKTVVQQTYALMNPDDYVNAWERPGTLTQLTMEDLDPVFSEGCDLVWTPQNIDDWTGYVDPATCQIYSERRGATIAIESEVRITNEVYYTTERGFDDKGTKLFGTDEGAFIQLYRQ